MMLLWHLSLTKNLISLEDFYRPTTQFDFLIFWLTFWTIRYIAYRLHSFSREKSCTKSARS